MWWNATEVDDCHALFLYPEGQGNNTSSILPQPFLVHDRKTEPRKTQFTHSKVALPVPITPPLNTVITYFHRRSINIKQ
jgi:1-acyl-sn-glycerol-3-phosphate acyltransferase